MKNLTYKTTGIFGLTKLRLFFYITRYSNNKENKLTNVQPKPCATKILVLLLQKTQQQKTSTDISHGFFGESRGRMCPQKAEQ